MKNNINALDIETFNENGKTIPYCICFNIGEKFFSFYGLNAIEDFFIFIKQKKKKLIFYVHNLSFDGGIFINVLHLHKLEYEGFFFRNSIYTLRIYNGEKSINLILKCSYKILPVSLEKIAEILNIESKKNFPHFWITSDRLFYKGPNPFDSSILHWDLKKIAIEYCLNDVLIVKKCIEEIFNEFKSIENLLNGREEALFKLTTTQIFEKINSISALSLLIFRVFFNKKNINFSNTTQEDFFLRKAYYGGRCEVHGNKKFDEKIHHFDFTSMYANVMKEAFCFGKITKSDKKDITISKPGFYFVKVESNLNLPLLPKRDFIDKKLLFPNGTWSGVYWWEELKFFQDNGGKIINIFEFWEFEKNERVFDDFITFFIEKRQKNKFANLFWKLFINSLSGRLGMQSEDTITKIMSYKTYINYRKNKIIVEELIQNNTILVTTKKNYIFEKKNELTNLSNVAISAAITAKARIKLSKSVLETINNGGRLLYCDTDSIFAAFKDEKYEQRQNDIIWDKKEIESAIFAIPKGYALKLFNGERIRLKGFPKQKISFEEFEKIWKNNLSMKIDVRQLSTKNLEWKFDTIEKTIYINSYSKRQFNKDKTETTSLVIKE